MPVTGSVSLPCLHLCSLVEHHDQCQLGQPLLPAGSRDALWLALPRTCAAGNTTAAEPSLGVTGLGVKLRAKWRARAGTGEGHGIGERRADWQHAESVTCRLSWSDGLDRWRERAEGEILEYH